MSSFFGAFLINAQKEDTGRIGCNYLFLIGGAVCAVTAKNDSWSDTRYMSHEQHLYPDLQRLLTLRLRFCSPSINRSPFLTWRTVSCRWCYGELRGIYYKAFCHLYPLNFSRAWPWTTYLLVQSWRQRFCVTNADYNYQLVIDLLLIGHLFIDQSICQQKYSMI